MTVSSATTEYSTARFNPWYELAGVGVAVIESAWVAVLFRSANAAAARTSSSAVLIYFALVFWAAFLTVRGFMQMRLKSTASRAILLVVYVAAVLIGIRLLLPVEGPSEFDPFTTSLGGLGDILQLVPAWFLMIPTLLWLFLRGAGAARQGVGTYAVQRSFKLGVVMFLVYSLLAIAGNRDLPGLEIFVVFLAATLLAMSAARVSILGRLRGGRRSPFSRGWFGSLAAGVAGTVLAALSFGMLTTGRFLMFYRAVVSWLLLVAVTVTLAPFLFVLGLFANTTVNPMPEPQSTPAINPFEENGFELEVSEQAAEQVERIPEEYRIYFYMAAAVVGVLIVAGLIFGVRTVTRRRQEAEVTEYILKEGDLLDALRREFERRRQAFQDRFSGDRVLERRQQLLAAARIRRIYSALLELAAGFGAARDPADTPLEFAVQLQHLLPSVRADLQRLTEAYLKVRYGELPERAEDVHAVEEAWARVKAAGEAQVHLHQQQLHEAARERRRQEAAP